MIKVIVFGLLGEKGYSLFGGGIKEYHNIWWCLLTFSSKKKKLITNSIYITIILYKVLR